MRPLFVVFVLKKYFNFGFISKYIPKNGQPSQSKTYCISGRKCPLKLRRKG
jgi:hypothetical protein